MIFLLVNHNLLYIILGTYPPSPFRNNQNSPKKIPFFQHFQQHFSSAEISSMQNFSSAGNLLERPTVIVSRTHRHMSEKNCAIKIFISKSYSRIKFMSLQRIMKWGKFSLVAICLSCIVYSLGTETQCDKK